MKYRVITACYDVTQTPPAPVKMTGGEGILEGSNDLLREEIIDTETNELFEGFTDVHEVEDRVLEFWNRLNLSSIDPPHYTHNARNKVVVVDCRPIKCVDLRIVA